MKGGSFFFLLFFLFAHSTAQTITTVAGIGSNGNSGDGGPAISAAIGNPGACIFDKNDNLFFTDVLHDVIRKIRPDGTISRIAGTGVSGYNGDNKPATDANLNGIRGLAFDSAGNLFFSEALNCRIRKIDKSTLYVSTVAGNGTWGFAGDNGPATAAIFRNPSGLAFDKKGNLYISDPGNYRIRKIGNDGVITTVVGSGISGDAGDGGPATNATIENVIGICIDHKGNLFFSEVGERIRKVNLATGIITAFAGTNPEGSVATGDGGPATAASIDPFFIVFDKLDNMFVAGYLYENVRLIDFNGGIRTIAGTGVAGYNGDNIPAINAELNSPEGVALDTCGNLYVSELRSYRIRKINLNPACWPTVVPGETRRAPSIFPNPAGDKLTINLASEARFDFVNTIGVTVISGSLPPGTRTFSLRSFAPGLYLLELTDDEGHRTVHKIIKQ